MKPIAYWITVMVVAFPQLAWSVDFYIEDKTLQPLPADMDATFRRIETDPDKYPRTTIMESMAIMVM